MEGDGEEVEASKKGPKVEEERERKRRRQEEMAEGGGGGGSGKRHKYVETGLVFMAFLLLGVTRAMQGPTLEDLKDQAGIELGDFAVVFGLGTISFPLGNLAGGFLLDLSLRCEGLMHLLMTFVLALLFLLHTGLAFSSSLPSLAVCSTAMEFAMGMVDTGCNVICLHLWKGSKLEDPFYTALFAFFNLGNILGPVAAGLFLEDEEEEVDGKRSDAPRLTHLQSLHVFVGAFLLAVTLAFLGCCVYSVTRSRRKRKRRAHYERQQTTTTDLSVKAAAVSLKSTETSSSFSSSSDSDSTAATIVPTVTSSAGFYGLVGLMSVFFLCYNGINFAYFNFLTAMSMRHPALGLTKTAGARATTVYFVASTAARLVTAFFLKRFDNTNPVILILLNLLVLFCGCSWLYLVISSPFASPEPALLLGCVLIGAGVSTLFSSGVLWLIRLVGPLSSSVMAVFLMATSVGAQFFKVPVAYWMKSNPGVVIHVVSAGACACAAFFGAAYAYARVCADGRREEEDDEANQNDQLLLQEEEKEDIKTPKA